MTRKNSQKPIQIFIFLMILFAFKSQLLAGDTIQMMAFQKTKGKICITNPLTFFDNTYVRGEILSVIWDMGDGTKLIYNKIESEVSYKYKQPGKYIIKQTIVLSSGYRDSALYNTEIIPKRNINFTYSPEKPSVGCPVQFYFNLDTFPFDTNKLTIDLGPSSRITGKFNPSFTYSALDAFKTLNTTLMIEDSFTCGNQIIKDITIDGALAAKYIIGKKVKINNKNYFQLSASYDKINPTNEPSIINDWTIIDGVGVVSEVKNTTHLFIPDTFSNIKGIHIKLKSYTETNGCATYTEIFHFAGLKPAKITVYEDVNRNKYYDAEDKLLPDMFINMQGIKSREYGITNQTGSRAFHLFETDSFTISVRSCDLNLNNFISYTPLITNIVLDSVEKDFFIPINFNYKTDWAMDILGKDRTIVRGSNNLYTIQLTNYSNIDAKNVTICLEHSIELDQFSSSETWTNTTAEGNKKTYTISNIPKLSTFKINLSFTANPNLNKVDDVRMFSVYIKGIKDSNKYNDSSVSKVIIIGPKDPNYKIANTEGIVNYGVKNIDYTINFENIGSAPARNVVVRDTISANFDITSIGYLSGNSPISEVQIENNNTLVFYFNNINLQSKEKNPSRSFAYFHLKLNLKNPLANFEEIQNRVGIYFDYESVVNTPYSVVKRLDRNSTSSKNISVSPALFISPNPVEKYFIVHGYFQRQLLQIFDFNGKLVFEQPLNGKDPRITVESFADGLYFLKLNNTVGKLIKY